MKRPPRLEALLTLATLIAPARALPRIQAAVELAYEHPATYVKKFRRPLHDRGIEEPEPNLPWVALLEALETAKTLTEIDWKTEAEDFQWALDRLLGFPKAKNRWAFLTGDPDLDERSTWELLELTGAALRSQQLTLGVLDLGSDSYPLIIVPTKAEAEVKRLARAAQYGSFETFGSQLAAAIHERRARAQRDARQQKRELAHAAAINRRWQYFARGEGRRTTLWCINIHLTAFDTSTYPPRGQAVFASHSFRPSVLVASATITEATAKAETQQAAREMIRQKRAEGFQRISKAESARRQPPARAPDRKWKLPPDATLLFGERRIIRALTLHGRAWCERGGALGLGFGATEHYYYQPDEAAARAWMQKRIDLWKQAKYREVSAAEAQALNAKAAH